MPYRCPAEINHHKEGEKPCESVLNGETMGERLL